MKTAVSIPDAVFREAELVAEHLGLNRSQLYSRALQKFLEQQEHDPVTASLDALADDVTAQATLNPGRALIDGGTWQW